MKHKVIRFRPTGLVKEFLESTPQGSISRTLNGILYEAIKSGSAFLELGKYADANALRKSRDICEATYSKSSEPLGQKSVETVVDNVEETVEVKESDVVVETPTPTPRKKITI